MDLFKGQTGGIVGSNGTGATNVTARETPLSFHGIKVKVKPLDSRVASWPRGSATKRSSVPYTATKPWLPKLK